MPLTILSIAYPFAPVGPGTAGGAEQILHSLDAALCALGHRSIVVAREDSQVSGLLVPVPGQGGTLDDAAMAQARACHREAIRAALRRHPVDLVHLHGVDFHTYLPPPGAPALATLHLPLDHYSSAALNPDRPDIWFNCVSASQQAGAATTDRFLPAVENGVDLDSFAAKRRKRGFALMLTRICPEKGIHLGIEAARRAGMPLLIAGEIFPYEAHRRYFRDRILPRLDRSCRYLGPVGGRAKRRLLAATQCLLVPSLVAETSSLAAREAAASGTPVITFARGALPQTVRHGSTGYVVEDVASMAGAIRRSAAIDPEICRSVAREAFSAAAMCSRYLNLYAMLARQAVPAGMPS